MPSAKWLSVSEWVRLLGSQWCDSSQEPPREAVLMQGLMDGDRQLQGCETAWVDGWH